jgi:hypothetical protein
MSKAPPITEDIKLGTEYKGYIVAKNISGEKCWKKKKIWHIEPPWITHPKMINTMVYNIGVPLKPEELKFDNLNSQERQCLNKYRSIYKDINALGIVIFESFLRMDDKYYYHDYVLEDIYYDKYPEVIDLQIPHIIIVHRLRSHKVFIRDNIIAASHSFIDKKEQVKSDFLKFISEFNTHNTHKIEWDGTSKSSIIFNFK